MLLTTLSLKRKWARHLVQSSNEWCYMNLENCRRGTGRDEKENRQLRGGISLNGKLIIQLSPEIIWKCCIPWLWCGTSFLAQLRN